MPSKPDSGEPAGPPLLYRRRFDPEFFKAMALSLGLHIAILAIAVIGATFAFKSHEIPKAQMVGLVSPPAGSPLLDVGPLAGNAGAPPAKPAPKPPPKPEPKPEPKPKPRVSSQFSTIHKFVR